MEKYFHIAKHFERLGWEHILRLPEHIFPNLIRDFYANMDKKNLYYGN